MTVFQKASLGLAVLLVILGIVTFSNSLSNPFVWDEQVLIVNNPLLQSWNILELFCTPFFIDRDWKSSEAQVRYRPVTMLSFWLDYRFWGVNPFGYHLTSTTLHVANSWLLSKIVWLLTGQVTTAAVVGAFFLIHPIHSSAVAYVPSRGDLLAGTGTLLMLLLHVDWRRRARPLSGCRLAVEMLAFSAALLSKEPAIVAPLILWGYERAYHRGEERSREVQSALRREAIGFSGILLAYGVVRTLWFTIGNIQKWTNQSALKLFGQTCTLYLGWLVWPKEIRFPVPVDLTFPGWVGIAWLLMGLLGFGWAFSRWGARIPWIQAARMGWFWWAFSLLPVSNLFLPIVPPFAAHFLYTPVMGLFLAGGVAGGVVVRRFLRPLPFRWGVVAGLVVLGLCLARQTIEGNRTWGDPEKLFRTSIRAGSPMASFGYLGLSSHYLKQGDSSKALKVCLEAIQRGYHTAPLYLNLVIAYQRLGLFQEAEKAHRVVIELQRGPVPYNLPVLVPDRGEIFKFAQAAQAGPQSGPLFVQNHLTLAQVLWEYGRYKDALQILEAVATLEPKASQAWLAYGDTLLALGYPGKAIYAYRIYLRLHPDSSEGYARLAHAFSAAGQNGEALRAYRLAIEVDPKNPLHYFNCGVALGNLGRYREAKYQWQRALALDPTLDEARRYLDLAAELENRR